MSEREFRDSARQKSSSSLKNLMMVQRKKKNKMTKKLKQLESQKNQEIGSRGIISQFAGLINKEHVTVEKIESNLHEIVSQNGKKIQDKLQRRMDSMSSFLLKAIRLKKEPKFQNSFLHQFRNKRGFDKNGELLDLDEFDLAVLRTEHIAKAIDRWISIAKASERQRKIERAIEDKVGLSKSMAREMEDDEANASITSHDEHGQT